MPFEVEPIKGPSERNAHTNVREAGPHGEKRTEQDVARDIEAFYVHAAEQGGRVIAGHTLMDPMLNAGHVMHEEGTTLYLVAELPEAAPAEEQIR